MRKTEILAITGLGAGVVGSIAGAIMTNKMYKANKEALENGEFDNEDSVKRAKWKTGLTAVGTTLLAGLAIASGTGLALSYSNKNNNDNDYDDNDYDEYSTNSREELSESEKEWLKALKDNDLIDGITEQDVENARWAHSMAKEEIKDFIEDMTDNKGVEDMDVERIQNILEDTADSMEKAHYEIDNADRNINVIQGIVEQS